LLADTHPHLFAQVAGAAGLIRNVALGWSAFGEIWIARHARSTTTRYACGATVVACIAAGTAFPRAATLTRSTADSRFDLAARARTAFRSCRGFRQPSVVVQKIDIDVVNRITPE
jgi:hypothetical protein